MAETATYPIYAPPPQQRAGESSEDYWVRLQQWAESPAGQSYLKSVDENQRGANEQRDLNMTQQRANIENARRQLELQVGTQRANEWAARERLKLDKRAQEIGQQQFGVNTALSLVNTAANLRGPRNLYQAMAFQRGVQNGGLSPYLTGLLGYGPAMKLFGSSYAQPEAASLRGLVEDATGTGSVASSGAPGTTGNAQVDQNLRAITRLGMNPHSAIQGNAWQGSAANQWNALSQDERDATYSGLDAGGFLTGLWDQQRRQAGIGQRAMV